MVAVEIWTYKFLITSIIARFFQPLCNHHPYIQLNRWGHAHSQLCLPKMHLDWLTGPCGLAWIFSQIPLLPFYSQLQCSLRFKKALDRLSLACTTNEMAVILHQCPIIAACLQWLRKASSECHALLPCHSGKDIWDLRSAKCLLIHATLLCTT